MKFEAGEGMYFTFGGYLENFSGLRVAGEHDGKIDAFRNTFQPELFFHFSERAKLFVSGQFVKETSYEMEDDANLPNDYYDQTDFEAYELYLDLDVSKSIHTRVGRQFVVWGETDIFRLLDIVNPQDSSWISSGAMPLEDTRIPNWMAKVSKTFGFFSSLELIFVPMLDDDDQRVNKGAPSGGRWAANPAPSSNMFSHFPQLGMDFFMSGLGMANLDASGLGVRMVPEKQLDESRFGARFRTLIKGFDLSFVAFYGHDYDPVLEYKGSVVETRRELADDGTGNAVYVDNDYFVPTVALSYNRQPTFGFAFNYYDDVFSKAVLRGEFAFLPDKHFNTIDPGEPSGVTEKDFFKYALGFDKELVCGFLHPDDPSTTFFFSIQMFQEIIFDHDDELRLAIYDDKINEVNTTFTAVLKTSYLSGSWTPEVAVAYNPQGSGLFRPRLTYKPPWDENYYIELTYLNYYGNHEYEPFGLLDDLDSIFLRVRYMW